MWLIVGLGNPGSRYTGTRHNIGFACLEHLAARHGLAFSRKRNQAQVAEGSIAGERVAGTATDLYEPEWAGGFRSAQLV